MKESFDDWIERHVLNPPPEFGPHPLRTNLTEAEAGVWWDSKTPHQRAESMGYGENYRNFKIEDMSVGFRSKWNELPERDRAAFLAGLRKGWIQML